MRQPDVEATSTPFFAPRSVPQSKRWLYLTQIGDDSADCLGEPNSASQTRRTYDFGDYIVVQCATHSDNAADEDQYVRTKPPPLISFLSGSGAFRFSELVD